MNWELSAEVLTQNAAMEMWDGSLVMVSFVGNFSECIAGLAWPASLRRGSFEKFKQRITGVVSTSAGFRGVLRPAHRRSSMTRLLPAGFVLGRDRPTLRLRPNSSTTSSELCVLPRWN